MKKLSETENNILRIEDLLQELCAQLDPLSIQAERASLYIDLRDTLKKVEINHSYRELNTISENLQKLETTQQAKQQELTVLQSEAETLSEKVQEVKARATALENQIQTRQKQLMEGLAQRERAMGELNLFAERKRSLQNRQEELTGNLAALREKKEALEQKQEQLCQSTAGIDREKNRLACEVKDLERALVEKEERIKELRNSLSAKKTLYTDKLAADSLLKQKISEAGAQKVFRQEKEVELRTELDLAVKEMAETEERLNAIKAKLETLRNEAEQAKSEERQLAAAIQKHQAYLEERVQKNQEIRERLRGLESKITVLTEMERSHQGYYQGVKALLQATREPFHQEIHGIIADIIRPEPGYELALEVALGSALQNLVITHHRHAGQAINYLKQNRLGRATFLPG